MHPIIQFVSIVGMMVLTAGTQIAGLVLLEPLCERYSDQKGLPKHGLVLITLALGLLAVHSLEIIEYAVFYWAVGALPLEASLFLSAGNYSTIGGMGVRLPVEWRLVGAFEGVNGMVMIGWSTAFLFHSWREIRDAAHESSARATTSKRRPRKH